MPTKKTISIALPTLKTGEKYAGILLKKGKPHEHIILLPGDASGTHSAMEEWAKKAGGELPSRRAQSLLFANLKEEFQGDWYWSGETHEDCPSYAWFQGFYDGGQLNWGKGNRDRARAVRRVVI